MFVSEYEKARSVRRLGDVILTSILNYKRDNDVTIPKKESAIRIIISICLPHVKVGGKNSRGTSVRMIYVENLLDVVLLI